MKNVFILCLTIYFLSLALGCETPDNGAGCDGADGNCPELEPYDWNGTGAPPSGPYEVVIEQDPDFDTHTVYRPLEVEEKMPITGCPEDF